MGITGSPCKKCPEFEKIASSDKTQGKEKHCFINCHLIKGLQRLARDQGESSGEGTRPDGTPETEIEYSIGT